MANFDKRSQKKLVDNVRYVSRLSRTTQPQRARYPVGGATIGQIAVVTTTITARSGSTAGNGLVTFKSLDPTSGALTDGQTGVKVWNPFAASIASGTYVTLMLASTGAWTVFDADCN